MQKSSPSESRPPKEPANCGSRLLKNTAIFGLPKVAQEPLAELAPARGAHADGGIGATPGGRGQRLRAPR